MFWSNSNNDDNDNNKINHYYSTQAKTIQETNRVYSLFIRAVIETSERVSKVYTSSFKIEI